MEAAWPECSARQAVWSFPEMMQSISSLLMPEMELSLWHADFAASMTNALETCMLDGRQSYFLAAAHDNVYAYTLTQ